jgi:asparagine synthase (glutamine-hydrolysing)
MVSELRDPACRIVSERTDRQGRFGLCRVSEGLLPTSPQPVVLGYLQAVMDGVLYDIDRLCGQMRAVGHRFMTDDHASVLLANYAVGGLDSLAKIEGSYSAAIVDLTRQSVTLIADRDGTHPLYYLHTRARFAFASSVGSLLVEVDASSEIARRTLQGNLTKEPRRCEPQSVGVIKLMPEASAAVFVAASDEITYYHISRKGISGESSRRA